MNEDALTQATERESMRNVLPRSIWREYLVRVSERIQSLIVSKKLPNENSEQESIMRIQVFRNLTYTLDL